MCSELTGLSAVLASPWVLSSFKTLAGNGVAMAAGKVLANAFSDRSFTSPLVELLLKNGRNGKNNGKGYYIFESGSKPKPDPSVLPIIEESRWLTNIMPSGMIMCLRDYFNVGSLYLLLTKK